MLTSKRKTAALFALVAMCSSGRTDAEQCGSALLLEVDAPAVFDGVDLSAPTVVRFWEAGAGGVNRSDDGCRSGCTTASGPQCAGGGDCIALTGVNWLNASCAFAGHLPLRTVFVLEQTTLDAGGRWAALNLDRNANDANTDIDAKAAAICGGCSSIVLPALGGDSRPVVTGSSAADGQMTVGLSWSAPSSAAQALSNGTDLVTGYGVYYRTHDGIPPPATGETAGWTRTSDVEPDGAANGGFSTDTSATVQIPLAGLQESITLAIRLSFDGSGDPVADANTLLSSFLSDDSEPVLVPTACGEPNHLVLEGQTISGAQELVACQTITAGNGFVVAATGDLILRAGISVTLQDGFWVDSGGKLAVVIDPSLSP